MKFNIPPNCAGAIHVHNTLACSVSSSTTCGYPIITITPLQTATNNTKRSIFHKSHLGSRSPDIKLSPILAMGYAHILYIWKLQHVICTNPHTFGPALHKQHQQQIENLFITCTLVTFQPSNLTIQNSLPALSTTKNQEKAFYRSSILYNTYLPNVRSLKFKFHLHLQKKHPLAKKQKAKVILPSFFAQLWQ